MLPIDSGGLSFPSVVALALPCFIASVNASSELIKFVLGSRYDLTDEAGEASAMWEQDTEVQLVNDAASRCTRTLVKLRSQAGLSRLKSGPPEAQVASRLMCLSSEEAGAFLTGPPSTCLRTRIDSAAFTCAIRIRMAQPVAAESLCSCGQDLDANGAYALACRRGAGKQIRHRILNEFVRRAFLAAGMPVLLEPTGLSRKNGKRPDGVTVLLFQNGRALSWDATCVHPLAASYADVALKAPKAVAALAETRKRSKYLPVLDRVDFVPLAVETTGAVGSSFL